MAAGAGADVDEVIGGAHGVLVVLHHNEGVAQVPQAAEGGQELIVVPLVEADRGLVQNVQHAHEAGADLGGQADALALAAGQGAGGAVEGQIAQAHRLQEVEPGANLLQNLGGNQLLVAGEGQVVEELHLVGDAEGGSVVDALAAHGDGQGLGL